MTRPASNTATYLQYAAFALMMFGVKLWLIRTYGNATPFWDQWNAEAEKLYKPYLSGTLEIRSLWEAHNEHRILSSRLLALGLLQVNAIWNPLLQMLANAALHILGLVCFIAVLARGLNRAWLPALLAFSAVLFGIPHAWENTLAGFQSQFYFVLLFAAGALSLCAYSEPLSRRWWIAVLFAILAFFSLSAGVLVAGACALTGCAIWFTRVRRSVNQALAVCILLAICLVGVAWTPTIEGHAFLQAHSLRQLSKALVAVLSWPLPANVVSVLFRNAPAAVLVAFVFFRPAAARDPSWLLVALVVWWVANAFTVAYGRAFAPLESRYLDFFALAIVVNGACLMHLADRHVGTRWRRYSLVGGWMGAVACALVIRAAHELPEQLSEKRRTATIQEANTRNYVWTGDMQHLKGKPHLHIPFPEAGALAAFLDDSVIRTILPANIRAPVAAGKIMRADGIAANAVPADFAREYAITWGSYGASGEATVGSAAIQFGVPHDAWLAIPVCGYPRKEGVRIDIRGEERPYKYALDIDAGPAWQTAFTRAAAGNFSIDLEDRSEQAWIGIAAPTILGRFDKTVHSLLNLHLSFIIASAFISVWLAVYCLVHRKKES